MRYPTVCGFKTGLGFGLSRRTTGIILELSEEGEVTGVLCPNHDTERGGCKVQHYTERIPGPGGWNGCEYEGLRISNFNSPNVG